MIMCFLRRKHEVVLVPADIREGKAADTGERVVISRHWTANGVNKAAVAYNKHLQRAIQNNAPIAYVRRRPQSQ